MFHAAILGGAISGGFTSDALLVLSRGVILFFLISGFLLYRPFVAARVRGAPAPRALTYGRRRVLRIVPAYWLALTVLAIFPGIPGVFSEDWWKYYFFLQSYFPDSQGLDVAWSLCVEVAFYLTLPLWAWGVGRAIRLAGASRWLSVELGSLGLLAAGGALIQIAAARQEVSQLVAQSLLGQCTWLALGMILAVVSVAVADRRPPLLEAIASHPGLCWLAAGCSYLGLVLLQDVPGGILGLAAALEKRAPLAETIGTILLTGALVVLVALPAVFAARKPGWPRRVLGNRALLWIGLISYGIYIWHLPLLELLALPATNTTIDYGLDLVARVTFATTPVLLITGLALTVAVAAASYYLVELPFLRRKER